MYYQYTYILQGICRCGDNKMTSDNTVNGASIKNVISMVYGDDVEVLTITLESIGLEGLV